MSKQYQIKWRDQDLNELKRVVSNFNRKRQRLIDKDPSAAEYLPEKLSVKQLKQDVKTRQDYNRTIKSAKRFGVKGSEKIVETDKGLKLTQYEVKETKIKTAAVNRKRKKEREALDISRELGNVGQLEKQNLKPKKFSLDKTPKEWEKFVSSLEKELSSKFKSDQLEKYKENYLKSLKDRFGDDSKTLHDLLSELDAETLYKKSIGNPFLSIDFHYSPEDDDIVMESLFEEWGL